MGLFEYIVKSRSGVYKDNPENRRLHRVGQRYGERKIANERAIATQKLPSKETLARWNDRKKSLGGQYKTIFSIEEFRDNKAREVLREKPILVYDSTKQPPILDKDKVLQFFKKSVAYNQIKDYMEMKNDFAKSILDNPYNRVEGGQKIELFNVLAKYRYQRQNRQLTTYVAYAEDLGITKEEALAYQNWINDGNPTGIESDEQFYEIQKQVYGKVVIKLSWL